MNLWAPFLAAAGLAAVHLFSQKLRVLDGVPRSRFLSIAGGMAVAFVILRLLPALGQGQETLAAAVQNHPLAFLQHHVYVVVLVSIIVYYGADRMAIQSRERNRARGRGSSTSAPVFWLSMGVFAGMNALIGYLLLHNQERSLTALALFLVAMALKFIVNDHALHAQHADRYDGVGRWLLAGAVFLGFGIRWLHRFPDAVPVILQATLAGAVLLNVLKEELPAARESRYWAFAVGASAYAVLLLAL